MNRGLPLVISAPSGAGKSTLIRELRRHVDGLAFSVSHTTRPARAGERDGVEYHFVDRERFEGLVAEDAFAEWAEVHGNLYGTHLATLEAQLGAGCDVILDIDVQGALQIAERVAGAVLVFILPPGPDELRARLEGRGLDAPEVIARRLANAWHELRAARQYDYLVVNDDLERAAEELAAVVRAERSRTVRRTEALDRLLAAAPAGG